MSDLSSTLSYFATSERILDSAGDLVAERERRHGLKALIQSQLIVDAMGQPLFKVVCRVGQISGRVDVFTPGDALVAHIKGKAYFGRVRKFTIRDGSGSVIGRIEGTWHCVRFRLLDNEERLRAHGAMTGRKAGVEWSVKVEDGQPHTSPWPELTAAFFLSRRALGAPKPPP